MEILLYVDPSPRGEWALGLGALLPSEFAREVCLLCTDEDLERDPQLLESARMRLGRPTGVRDAHRPGPAEAAVAHEVAQGAYGLVLVPPAGRGAIRRLLKGSRVATVVRSVRCPVLVARRPPERITRILVAVSGEGATEVVVRAASGMAAAFGAQCTFLHVSSEVALPYHGTPEVQAAGTVGPAEAAAHARDVVGKAFPTAEFLLSEGLVVDEILDAFEGGAHHLLVVGGQGEEDSPAWGRENVTERLLLACPGSTLIVPRQS